jgi:hypothetical protein
MADRNASSRSGGDPWFGQNTLSYFPVNALPKLSSRRLLDRTMMGDCPKYSSIARNCPRMNVGKVPDRIFRRASSAPLRKEAVFR